jgi:hypothetical protein
MLPKFWKKLRSTFTARRPVLYRIKSSDQGLVFFCDNDGKVLADIAWTDIVKIRAFKRDLFAVDEICMRINFDQANGIVVSENDPGYDEFIHALSTQLHVRLEDWFDAVAFPAFATNETLIYKRA